MLAGIAIAAPVGLYVRFVDNPGVVAMALACFGAALILLALFGWRRNPGYGVILTGLTLNAIVILANGGRMPVVDFDSDNYGSLWQPATVETRYVFLADQQFLGYASVGDIAIGAGLAVVLLSALHRRLHGARPAAEPVLQA